jgi:hypothetical protein
MALNKQSSRDPAVVAMADEQSALSISPEKVYFIVLKARQFDVKDASTLEDDGSDPPTTLYLKF